MMENTDTLVRKLEDGFTIPKSDKGLLNIKEDKSFEYTSMKGIVYEGTLYEELKEVENGIKVPSYDFKIRFAK